MVNATDQDFYNTYRLMGGRRAGFGEIFRGYSPEDIKELKRNYRKNEKELKIAHKKSWDMWKCEKIYVPSEIIHCCG
ncbi:MAG: hypothetical protein KAR00_00955 [Candidatus Pacebacteria bacterium]|nr:hypothetical protein [Candidatus Paceibacterota bacterium]